MRVLHTTSLAAVLLAATVAVAPALAAPKCIKAGGIGNGITEGIAQFMAEAAMKNSAKAWGGDAVKIGKVAQSCKWETVAFSCTASARACK